MVEIACVLENFEFLITTCFENINYRTAKICQRVSSLKLFFKAYVKMKPLYQAFQTRKEWRTEKGWLYFPADLIESQKAVLKYMPPISIGNIRSSEMT